MWRARERCRNYGGVRSALFLLCVLGWLVAGCGGGESEKGEVPAPGAGGSAPVGTGGRAGAVGSGGAAGATAGVSAGGAGAGGSAGATSPGGEATGGATLGGSSSGGAAGGSAGSGGNAGGDGGNGGAGGSPSGGAGGVGGGAAVDLPAGVTGLFPLPGAVNTCADPALRLRFGAAPKLGNAGKLRVLDAASNAAVVTIDFATSTVTQVVGGQSFQQARPVFIEGSDVVVPLLSQALGYGKQFYVTVESGAIVPAGGGTFSISDSKAWRFSTLAAAPTGNQLSVALDGSGQFCSWQGALDAVPAKNTAAVTVTIKAGIYHGLVYLNGKQNITLRGQDRKATILTGTNNDKLNAGTRARSLFGADSTGGLVIENVTIRNETPQGGSQAEALRLQGCDKCVVKKSDFISLQDTLLWSGVIYAEDCYIAGNVDWIWGTGSVFFNRCEIKNVGRSGYIVQARNAAGKSGYVFVDSKLTADAGISGTTLARIDVSVYPDSHVAFINCTMGSHISRAGWTVTGGSAPASLRFWEYQSKSESGALLDVSGRTGGKQISADQAAQMRDPLVVLGWQPP